MLGLSLLAVVVVCLFVCVFQFFTLLLSTQSSHCHIVVVDVRVSMRSRQVLGALQLHA